MKRAIFFLWAMVCVAVCVVSVMREWPFSAAVCGFNSGVMFVSAMWRLP